MDKSKRNLAKALGVAGAGVVAWKKPVVDTVSIPAHAQTTCGDLQITWIVTTPNSSREGSAGYTIWAVDAEGFEPCDSDGEGGEFTGEFSYTQALGPLPPGDYEVCAGSGVSSGGGGASGTTTVSCCDSEVILGSFETGEESAEGGGCVALTIDTEGRCGTLSPFEGPPSCESQGG